MGKVELAKGEANFTLQAPKIAAKEALWLKALWLQKQ
jgi:hypothetical protein